MDSKAQKYMEGLSEYDKGRYKQLLDKNQKLKDELKNITDATQGILNKERFFFCRLKNLGTADGQNIIMRNRRISKSNRNN